jgi:lysophospholipase L1-like esterase
MQHHVCVFGRYPLWTVLCLFVVAAATLVPGCGGGKKDTTRYVALGDSIAYGPVAVERSGYVYEFADLLRGSVDDPIALNNRAVPLIKSGDLLSALKDDVPPGLRGAVRNAQILTISIGGNNLLGCADNNYNNIDTACTARGVSDFAEDWPQILAEIRTGIGSTARLYVMTLYNPYKEDDPNFAVADAALQQINAVIQNPAYQATYNYKVADVYTDFRGRLPDGTEKTCAWTRFCESERDPHPNQVGHGQIATLHAALYP